MERLTYLKDGRWRIDLAGGQRCFYSQLFIDRLAAYENTGFTPEEFKELTDAIKKFDIDHMHYLLKAESDGHLVVTPCKVGDDVYFLIPDDMADGGIYVSDPNRVTEAGSRGFWISGFVGDPDGMHDFIPWEELGKSVFLTREEADVELSSTWAHKQREI